MVSKLLRDQRGASIILALGFLLMCTLLATAVLNSALTNAHQLRASARSEQTHLNASSALELGTKMLEDASSQAAGATTLDQDFARWTHEYLGDAGKTYIVRLEGNGELAERVGTAELTFTTLRNNRVEIRAHAVTDASGSETLVRKLQATQDASDPGSYTWRIL